MYVHTPCLSECRLGEESTCTAESFMVPVKPLRTSPHRIALQYSAPQRAVDPLPPPCPPTFLPPPQTYYRECMQSILEGLDHSSCLVLQVRDRGVGWQGGGGWWGPRSAGEGGRGGAGWVLGVQVGGLGGQEGVLGVCGGAWCAGGVAHAHHAGLLSPPHTHTCTPLLLEQIQGKPCSVCSPDEG